MHRKYINKTVLSGPMEKFADEESTPCCSKHVQRLVQFAKRISKSNQFTKSSPKSFKTKQSTHIKFNIQELEK